MALFFRGEETCYERPQKIKGMCKTSICSVVGSQQDNKDMKKSETFPEYYFYIWKNCVHMYFVIQCDVIVEDNKS